MVKVFNLQSNRVYCTEHSRWKLGPAESNWVMTYGSLPLHGFFQSAMLLASCEVWGSKIRIVRLFCYWKRICKNNFTHRSLFHDVAIIDLNRRCAEKDSRVGDCESTCKRSWRPCESCGFNGCWNLFQHVLQHRVTTRQSKFRICLWVKLGKQLFLVTVNWWGLKFKFFDLQKSTLEPAVVYVTSNFGRLALIFPSLNILRNKVNYSSSCFSKS